MHACTRRNCISTRKGIYMRQGVRRKSKTYTYQMARLWSSPRIQTQTRGTKAETTKPTSILKLVNKINHLFLVPFLTSPVASEAATEPAGYSPPIPIPVIRQNKSARIFTGASHTQKEPTNRKHYPHALLAPTGAVTTSTQSREKNQDNR